MAICSYGPIVDGVRGSIGGTTFQKNASGSIIRAKPRPPTPGLLTQRVVQTQMATASQMWRNLIATYKPLWMTYAASVILTNSLGKTYSPTACQMFTWLITLQEILGITPLVTTAPALPGLAATPTLTLAWSGNDLHVTAITPTPNAGEKYLFRLFRPDYMRAWPRTTIFLRSVFDGGTALPWTIGAAYKNSLKTGAIARGHLKYRFYDLTYRSTITLKTYIDFTAT